MSKKIGIVTGGGDCGGINAAIEAVVKSASNEGWEVYGIRKGWEGLIFGDMSPLNISDVEGIHSRTGTILQTSRTNPFNYTGDLNDGSYHKRADVSKYVIENARKAGLEAIIACGGDDTLSVIPKLIEVQGTYKILWIAVPKTMDGDIQVYSLGLDTAINRAMQVVEDFIPVLKANSSVGIVEVFGRDVGRVAFKAGIASGADAILLPEVPIDMDYLCDFVADRYNERAKSNNSPYVSLVIAEGTNHPITGKKVYLETGEDSFGHGKLGGIGDKIAKLIYDRLKDDPRIRAHTQTLDIKTQRPTYDVRGGNTLYSDSYIGQKLGAAAVQYLKNGAENGMAVVNFNEHGQVELMPAQKLIKPRPVHIEVLRLFENSGLYCFGRRPSGQDYKPTPIISSSQ